MPEPARPLLDFLKSRAGVLGLMACVGASFVLMLWAGFWFSGRKAPAEISAALPVALLVLAFGVAALFNAIVERLRHRAMAARINRQAASAPPWRPPDSEGLCLHLAPVESAMRRAGVELHVQHHRHHAACCIDRARFASAFGPVVAAMYTERHEIDRSIHDPKTAFFQCSTCDSTLNLIHPEWARDQTVWFPAPSERHA